MKKLILLVSIVVLAHAAQSQIFSWGIKGGVNSAKIKFDDFGLAGDPTVTVKEGREQAVIDDINAGNILDPNDLTVTIPNVTFTPSSYDLGYHVGLFARIKILAVYIQPELIFTQANANINVSGIDSLGASLSKVPKLTYNNFDIPVLVGFKLGPARLFAGPVATFNLSNNADEATEQIQQGLESFTAATRMATFGGTVGAGVDILKKVTLDLRYEFGLSQVGDDIKVFGETFKTDQRQSQFIASIGWIF